MAHRQSTGTLTSILKSNVSSEETSPRKAKVMRDRKRKKKKRSQTVDIADKEETVEPAKHSVRLTQYPASIAFIISNEFCERFNYFGLRTILVLYLTTKLDYDEENSTILFHTFTMLVYLSSLIGAIIADSLLGKFKTILILSLVYTLGGVVLALGAVPPLMLPVKAVTFAGLLLIALGTGGIKPCVAAFGGDQFRLPEQAEELATFFAIFYFAINAGSMISTVLTPLLRADVHCFQEHDCFSLAFGVPALLMLISVLIFVIGKRRYVIKPAEGNMIFGIVDCITEAGIGWLRSDKFAKRQHWLEYAEERVGRKMVYETRCLLNILVLYLPLPVFWALFDQQGSRWVFQATRMDGLIFGFVIKPDQMQVLNPLLILVFIPIFDYAIYPLLGKIGIRRPLQKLTLGGMLAALAFVCAALTELRIQRQEPKKLDAMTAQLRLYNGSPCRYEFELNGIASLTGTPHVIDPLSMWSDRWHNMATPRSFEFSAKSVTSNQCPVVRGTVQLEPGHTSSYFFADSILQRIDDEHIKPSLGKPSVRALFGMKRDEGPVVLTDAASLSVELDRDLLSQTTSVQHGLSQIEVNGVPVASFETQQGGEYTVMLYGSQQEGYQSKLVVLHAPRSVSILWQLPQIVIITAAEIMFSVTGLEFSFTQAPPSMKSVLQACWLVSVATGNVLVVIITRYSTFSSRATEFELFAVLMFIDMLVFMALASQYKYEYQATDSYSPA